ncbi:MAG: hypothetical protein ACFFC1_08260, partial [Promethearchaeota archaeon]
MIYSTDKEYSFKATLVFWKFYELGLYFSLPDMREFLEKESSYKVYKDYHCAIKEERTGSKCHQPLK